MKFDVRSACSKDVLPLRTRFRAEMNCQIVHDSIHRREGWTVSHLFECERVAVGFGSVALAGPWKDKPTIFEFYVLPQFRTRAFVLFETLVKASGARFLEVQSNDSLLAVMLHTYGRDISSEKIVFADGFSTAHPANGATVRPVTPEDKIRVNLDRRQDGGEWLLEIQGAQAGTGGILFHYNLPYGDIFMEVAEPFRQRGFGAYFVQELKRACYQLGAVPCARCSPANIASRSTLQSAGFVPFAHILNGTILTP